MAIIRRCAACHEPLVKSAKDEGGVVLLGVVVAFPKRLTVICRKCGHETSFTSPILAVRAAVILPDRPATR
jgi:RNase P subunit RPR2